MSPAKSVIDVDVNDERFKRFKELFDKYNAALKQMPDSWGKVADKQSEMGKGFEAMTAALMAQLELARRGDDEDEKRVKRLELSEKLWTSIKHSSQSTATAMIQIGRGLLGLTGLALGAATAGIYGLDRLGAAAGDARRSATGLGLSIGQQRAFANSFGRFVDPSSFLSGISAAQSDVSKQGSLWSIGVNPNQDAASLAIDTLKHVRALALATPLNQLGILESSRRLDQLGLGVEDLRRLRSTSNSEFNRQIGTYQTGVGALNIQDQVAEKWQNFVQSLERAGTEIENVLVDKLVPLAGPVGKVSEAFVHLVERVAAHGEVGKEIDGFAKWIDSLSGAISKPEFLTNVDNFVSDIGAIAGAVHAVVGGVGNMYNGIGAASTDVIETNRVFWGHLWDKLFDQGPDKGYFRDLIRGASARNHANLPLSLGVAQLESSMGEHMGTQPGGATGLFQLKPVWYKYWGEDPHDPKQNADMGTKTLALLDKKYHDLRKDLAAFTLGEPTFNKLTDSGRDPNWYSRLDRPTQTYVDRGAQIILRIENNTGGNVTVAAQQLAPN